ncbi:hypothetical protein AALO_G00258710 [Alosa alosa]|uniref:Uncharacterized protein n=1 Tax=Alosa alosa TaxID=278164 RepID=A0AAV6FQT9_9TELE|nr:hypothetical protein AALO_G00258710 [Alosa alosa]
MDMAAVVQPYMFKPESDPEGGESPALPETQRIQQDAFEWCTCGNCATMPSEPENLCCQEVPQVTRRLQQLDERPPCMIGKQVLNLDGLNVFSLQNACNIYRADYGPLKLRGIEQ